MTSTEETTVFACAGDTLLGILARPATPADTVVVVVGGPQYRAGSHRQFLRLPRALAASGIAVQRIRVHALKPSPVVHFCRSPWARPPATPAKRSCI